MTRISKIQAKTALSFCTLFCLWPAFAFSQLADTSWVRRYNGPGNANDSAVAIAVDSGGNVYVTGSSFDSTSGYDYATIKYRPNGDTDWVRRYNGPANKDDFAAALALDGSGNIYVTGRSNGGFATLKYDPAGNQLWVKTLPDILVYANKGAYDLALDKYGNVYVTGVIWDGEASTCWGTVKYDSAGNQLWFRNFYTGRIAVAIAVDADGNAYVTGYGYGPNLADYLTVKYYPNGDTAWARRYNGPDNGDDFATDVGLDAGGNTYVTGRSSGSFATIRYDSSGNERWVQRFYLGLPGGGGNAVAVDKDANVYATGEVWDGEVWVDWGTLKYDSAGNQLWFRSPGAAHAFAIALDTSGNAYVTGDAEGSFCATAKYDGAGNQLWFKKYNGGIAGWNQGLAIAADGSGNAYVTGRSEGAGTGTDFVTIKYSPLPQIKGDLNLDGALSAADAVLGLNCTFLGEPPPAAPIAADLNCDGFVTPADVVILLNMVFLSTGAPC